MGHVFYAESDCSFRKRWDEKVKLLHVNLYCSPEGGLEQYMLGLCRVLEEEGHENIIVYGSKGTKAIDADLKTFFLPEITSYGCPDFDQKIAQLDKLITNEEPDFIIIHQVLNQKLVEFLAKAKPHLRFVHGLKLTCPTGRRLLKQTNKVCEYPLNYFCQWRAYKYRCMPRNPRLGLGLIKQYRQIAAIHKKYSPLVVTSKFMKRLLIQNGFKPEKITVIPYFTSLPELPEKDKITPQILCVARLGPEKGVDYLLRAFSRISTPAELVIVGDGPALAELKEEAKALGISSRTTFVGWLDNEDISRFYHQCRLVVFTSILPEPFGIVGIEAMAHAKPVVAFDVGGVSEWLADNKTGYLVKRGDESGLADKIEHLLAQPEQAVKMGREGRREAQKRFTKQVHLGKLLDLIEQNTHGLSPAPSLVGERCFLCGSHNINPLFRRGESLMLKCQDCSLVYEFPHIDKNTYLKQINEHYSKVDPSQEVALSRKRLYEGFLRQLRHPKTPDSRILDIGCGQGYFLFLAKNDGWDTYGVEINPGLVRVGNKKYGVNIQCVDFKEAEFPDKYFDVITLWNVFDEILDPLKCIMEIKRILKPGGLLYLRTPNAAFHIALCRAQQKLEKIHLAYLLPHQSFVFHILNFSADTLYRILSQNGFCNIKLKNSDLTSGDPYGVKKMVGGLKILASFVANAIFTLSAGKIMLAPSIEVYAKNAGGVMS